jgi:hypothetical protein
MRRASQKKKNVVVRKETKKSSTFGALGEEYRDKLATYREKESKKKMGSTTITMENLLEIFKNIGAQNKTNVSQTLFNITDKYGYFDGKDVTKYLRNYDLVMETSEIEERTRVAKFPLVSDQGLRTRIENLPGFDTKDWKLFKH